MKADKTAIRALIADLQEAAVEAGSLPSRSKDGETFAQTILHWRDPPISPFTYWSRMAVGLAEKRDHYRIYFFETIFAGSAILFLYFIAFSPPVRPTEVVDLLIVFVTASCTLLTAGHFALMARQFRNQLLEAIKQADWTAEEETDVRTGER